MEETIQLKHPTGKKAVSMNKGKYDVLKKPFLTRLKTKGDSTHSEILHAIIEEFRKNDTRFEGSIEWHMEWVKLDLEARNEIKRVGTKSPVKFSLVTPI